MSSFGQIENLWTNFIEAAAKLLAMSLTTNETETIVSSFQKFSERVRELSSHNLRRLRAEQEDKRPFCKHTGLCRSNCLRGFLKSFVSACVIKYGIAVVQHFLTGRLKKKPWLAISSIFDKDTLQFALFFGSFIGGFKGLNCLLRKYRQKEDRYNAFIAGSVAALSLGFDQKDRRIAIMLYLLSRAMQTFVYSLQKQKILPIIPHGDTLCMGLLNSQIIYAYVCRPTSLSRSYFRWIYDLADLQYFYGRVQAQTAMRCLGDIANGKSIPEGVWSPIHEKSTTILQLNQMSTFQNSVESFFGFFWRAFTGQDYFQTPGHHFNYCQVSHPDSRSCTLSSLRYAARCFPKAFRMYLPLNVISLLLWRGDLLQKDPKEFLKRLLKSSIRSSGFITLFASLAWLVPCYVRHYIGHEWHPTYFLNGFVSGCSVILEQPPGRRVELVLYCLPRALESIWNLAVENKFLSIRPVKHGEVLLFSLSMGYLMTEFQNDKDLIPAGIRPVFTRIFGEN